MKKINELYIFDLDETLLRVPSYTDKFAVERLNPDISFNTPYEFYDHPLSLCDTINNIQLIEPIYREWEEANADLSCGHVLITHRVFNQKNTVIDLLKRKGVVFDHTYFLGRASAKSNCLHYILNEVYYIEENMVKPGEINLELKCKLIPPYLKDKFIDELGTEPARITEKMIDDFLSNNDIPKTWDMSRLKDMLSKNKEVEDRVSKIEKHENKIKQMINNSKYGK